jgi:heparan-alpha-glucosaminide N-acetyltransferase
MAAVNTPDTERLLSLDVFRGVVILLLIPDTIGGFSFYAMAERHPDEPVWSLLAAAFSHVKWSGASIWDLIMPAFVFIAGVSMSYSYASRKVRGESQSWILIHAALRALALLVLHLTLSIPVTSNFDYLWPLAILALGSQLPRKLVSAVRTWSSIGRDGAELCLWVGVLALVTTRGVLRFEEIPSFDLSGILPSLGLAYFVAYLFVPLSPRAQAAGVLSLLFFYWLAFALYRLPPTNIDPALYGITSPEETFSGFMSHWNKGTHIAAALDVWLLNLFPRHYPYTPPIYGTHTLRFIPLAATLLFGALVGHALRCRKPSEHIRNRIFCFAIIGVALALLLDQWVEPMVMRIWTSSWTLYSTGLVLILFVGLYSLIDVNGHKKWATVFVVAGANSLLLYVLAIAYRWPVISVWRRVFGSSIFDGYWQPVAESLAFGLTLWVVVFALYRFRVFVRL